MKDNTINKDTLDNVIERISIRAEKGSLIEAIKSELSPLIKLTDDIDIDKIIEQSYLPFTSIEPAPRPFWLTDFLPKGQVVLLAGLGGEGKSRLSLQILLHCLLNDNLSDQITVKQKINKTLIFTAEDDKGEIHKRLHQLKSFFLHRGISEGEINEIEKKIMSITDETKGIGTLLTTSAFGKIIPTHNYDTLKEIIHQEQPELIILDALTSLFSVGDWGSMSDTQEVMRLCKNLINGSNSTIILIHHMTKGAFRPQNFDELVGTIFGSVGTINRLRHILIYYKQHLIVGKSNINGQVAVKLTPTDGYEGFVSDNVIIHKDGFNDIIKSDVSSRLIKLEETEKPVTTETPKVVTPKRRGRPRQAALSGLEEVNIYDEL